MRFKCVALVFLLGGILPSSAAAATVPAIAAFEQTIARTADYFVTVRAHEVLGNRTQDRIYRFWFKRPHEAKSLIVSGPGAGGFGVWNGGDLVSGHPGGIFSFLRLRVSLHDRRATSLRGYTIVDGLLQTLVAKYTQVPGKLSERPGPDIDGQPTEIVQLDVDDPARYDHVSRGVLYFRKQPA